MSYSQGIQELRSVAEIYNLCNFNMSISNQCNDMAKSIGDGEATRWNYLWVTPLNLAGSCLGIVLAPVAAAVNLAASLVFALAACCSTGDERVVQGLKAFVFLGSALSAVTDNIITLFARIFAVKTDELTYFGPTVSAKLIACHYGMPPEAAAVVTYNNVALLMSFVRAMQNSRIFQRLEDIFTSPRLMLQFANALQSEDDRLIPQLIQTEEVQNLVASITRLLQDPVIGTIIQRGMQDPVIQQMRQEAMDEYANDQDTQVLYAAFRQFLPEVAEQLTALNRLADNAAQESQGQSNHAFA